jgi:LPXTG-motif cell wall-anchored protein
MGRDIPFLESFPESNIVTLVPPKTKYRENLHTDRMLWLGLVVVLATGGILSGILETLTGLIAQYGYPAVFAAAFLEVIFPPIPSEVIFPLVGYTAYSEQLGLENAIGMAATGASGSTAGAIMIYFISKKVGRAAILRFGRHVRIDESDLVKAEKWFQKYGAVAVLTGRMVPVIREIISIPAGIGGMSLSKFIIYTFLGSLLWSVALTLVGYYLGEAWDSFSDELSSMFTIIGIAVIAAIIGIVGILFFRRKNKAHAKEEH